jgi:hypothetical protein
MHELYRDQSAYYAFVRTGCPPYYLGIDSFNVVPEEAIEILQLNVESLRRTRQIVYSQGMSEVSRTVSQIARGLDFEERIAPLLNFSLRLTNILRLEPIIDASDIPYQLLMRHYVYSASRLTYAIE